MKKSKFYIGFILMTLSVLINGQEQLIDSLISDTQNIQQNDINKIDTYYAWQRIFNESKDSGSDYRMEEICISLGDYFFENKLYDNAISYYAYIFNTKIDTTNKSDALIEIYRKIGQSYSMIGKPDSSLVYYNAILDEFGYPERVDILRDLVDVYSSNNDHQKSLEYNIMIKDLLLTNEGSRKDLFKVYNNIGYNYNKLQDYENAILYFNKSLSNPPLLNSEEESTILRNLGICHFNLRNNAMGIDHLTRALAISNINEARAEISLLIATIYQADNDYFNAIQYFDKAETYAKSCQNQLLLSDIYAGYAVVYNETHEYDLAFEYFKNHSRLRDSLDFLAQLNQKRILDNQKLIDRTEKENRILKAQQNFQKLKITQLETEANNQKLQNEVLRADSIQASSLLDIEQKKNEIAKANEKNNQLEIERQNNLLQVASQQLEIARTNEEKNEIEEEKRKKEYELARQTIDLQTRDAELKKEQNENQLQSIEIERRKTGQRNSVLIALLLAGLALFILWAYRNKRRDNEKLTVAYDNLNQAQSLLQSAETKIRGLLSQQVSGAVAEALISDSNTAPDLPQFVSIMFLDIRDFTVFCEGRKPREIIDYQNKVFGFMIDIIEEHHGVVNQLMGDGFMATFGAPMSVGNDCLNAYKASQNILRKLEDKVLENKIPPTRIGIGIHAGNVVTGNVGNEKRKQFSITGNTVILAARLEQLNKQFGTSLVFSKEFYEVLPEEDRIPVKFKPVMVKGRSHPIEVGAI